MASKKTYNMASIIGVLIVSLFSAPASAAGEQVEHLSLGYFTTAAGERLHLPALAELACDDIDRILTSIDATRYRENAPTPHNPADRPLYEYEMKLAQRQFKECVRTQSNTGDYRMLFRPANR